MYVYIYILHRCWGIWRHFVKASCATSILTPKWFLSKLAAWRLRSLGPSA
jgi:hypothetical protein